jgi:hypothetical protein
MQKPLSAVSIMQVGLRVAQSGRDEKHNGLATAEGKAGHE